MWGLVAALVVVAFVLGAALWPFLLPWLGLTLPPGLAPAPELEARVAALEARAAESDRLGRAVGGEVAGVAATVTSLGERLERLAAAAESPAPALEGLAAELAALAARLEKIEAAAEAAPAAGADPRLAARVAALEGALAAAAEGAAVAQDVGRETAALATRLGAFDARRGGLEGAALGQSGRDAALVIAVGQLKAAARGSGGFAGSLAAVAALAGDDAAFEGLLAELAGPAGPGVPTAAELGAGFAGLADAIVRAEAAARRDGWVAIVMDWVGGLVSLRRTGELEGEAVEARLARAERDLEAGDLAAAVAELEGLEGAAAAAALPWLSGARARLAVERALGALERRVIAGLGAADR
ncbi:MAG: mitofilin family membrane protein [Alphaproteobacteria bacterium]